MGHTRFRRRKPAAFVMATVMSAAVAVATGVALSARPRAEQPAHNKQAVTFKSGQLTLVGVVYKPDGAGPFPTVIWNHGSEKTPGRFRQFDVVADIFVPAGYVVFAPSRRGHDSSEGAYIGDQMAAEEKRGGPQGVGRLMVRLHETEQLDDQFAGIAYAKTLPFVDTNHMVVAGCSFGGIQSLLAAERGGGLKAAFSISPAALTWGQHPQIRDRLRASVHSINIPVRLIQPPKDASLEPARVLGEEARKAGKDTFITKVYSPDVVPKDEQGHCFGGAKGFHNWAREAEEFFDGVLGIARPQ
jgi:dienelactone hydrolase